MNLTQAEEKLSELQKELLKHLCPLTKDLCRKDCMSYYEGDTRADSYEQDEWRVISPRCESPIVTGVIVVET